MKTIRSISWFLLLTLIIHSLSVAALPQEKKKRKPHRLQPSEYLQWVEGKESGLNTSVAQGVLNFSVQYRPLEYIILKEQGRNKTIGQKQLRKCKKQLKGMEYYSFSIAFSDGRKDVIKSIAPLHEDYKNLLLYFSNDMQGDLKLVQGSDTIDCSLFHFERTYGITPYVRFVLGFEMASPSIKLDRSLLFFAHRFDLEVVQLKLNESAFQANPRIDLKN